MIGAERKSGLAERLMRAGGDIFIKTSPETKRSIWERYPKLRELKENSPEKFPRNVFIIPDGNGRWAAARKLAVQAGHEKGAEVIVNIFNDLSELSEYIPYVGAWGLSMDNLKRPQEEVDFLMNLFQRTIRRLQPDLQKRGNRFIHLGRKDIFANFPHVRETIEEVEEETKKNTGQIIYISIGFSGTDQNLRINQKLAEMALEGKITSPEDVTPDLVNSLKDGQGLIPTADLIIRTSGEERLSDVGWIAGKETELYFSRKLFPSFTTDDFVKSLINFSKRERRFGGRPSQNLSTNHR